MTDIRRLRSAFTPGVVILPGVPPLLVGVWWALDVDRDGSGVLEGVSRSFDACRLGASEGRDLAFPGILLSSEPVSSPRCEMCLKVMLFPLSALDFLPAALGRRLTVDFSDASGATKVPGPTDFLGALAPPLALLKEFGGKWLCLLPRRIDVAVAVIGSDLREFREVLEAVEFLRVTGVTPEPFREGTGMAGCETGFFCSAAGASDGGAIFPVVAGPGKGNWFKLGSVPTMVS